MFSKTDLLLKNLVLWQGRVNYIADGIKKLKGREETLEASHIYIEPMDYSAFRKKQCCYISRRETDFGSNYPHNPVYPSKISITIIKNVNNGL